MKTGYNLIQHDITDNLSMDHSMDHDHDLMCKWDTGHRTLSWSSGLTLITYSWECTQLSHALYLHLTTTFSLIGPSESKLRNLVLHIRRRSQPDPLRHQVVLKILSHLGKLHYWNYTVHDGYQPLYRDVYSGRLYIYMCIIYIYIAVSLLAFGFICFLGVGWSLGITCVFFCFKFI